MHTSERLARVRLFWRASGAALALLAAAGFALVAMGRANLLGANFLVFDTTHNALHAALAAASLVLGFAPLPPRALVVGAQAFGLFYFALAVVGFINGGLFGLGKIVGTRLELVENVLHLGLGAWAAYVGFQEE